MNAFFENLLGFSDPTTLLNIGGFENLYLLIHIKDLQGRYVDYNPRLVTASGLDNPNELFNRTDFDFPFLPENQARLFRKHDAEVIAKDTSQFFVEPCTLADNKSYVCFSQKSAYRGKSKKIIGNMSMSLLIEKQSVNAFSFTDNDVPENTLTKRQIDCLLHLIKGMTIKQIAKTLGLSPKTTEHYLEVVKDKLACNNRAELIAKAMQLPIIKQQLFHEKLTF